MEMELSLDEQTLLATFRNLDDAGKKELLRHASQQQKMDAVTAGSVLYPSGQCRLEKSDERPESVAEPIFTE